MIAKLILAALCIGSTAHAASIDPFFDASAGPRNGIYFTSNPRSCDVAIKAGNDGVILTQFWNTWRGRPFGNCTKSRVMRWVWNGAVYVGQSPIKVYIERAGNRIVRTAINPHTGEQFTDAYVWAMP